MQVTKDSRGPSQNAALSLIGLPYLFGVRGPSPRNQMALGPDVLLSNEALLSGLRSHFSDVAVISIEDADDPMPAQTAGYDSLNVVGLFAGDQLSRMLVQNSRLAEEVRKARKSGRIPLAATGACSAAIGMVAGLGHEDEIGMIWFDAHDDASTPETSVSGLMEGMPVSMIAGRCWQAYCRQIPGFREIPSDRILSIGLHEQHASGPERQSSQIGSVVNPVAILKQGYEAAVEVALLDLSRRCRKVYVHVDVDVLDPSVVLISHHMAHGGLTLEQLEFALSRIADHFEIVGLDYSCFDPSMDPNAPDILARSMVTASKVTERSRKQ